MSHRRSVQARGQEGGAERVEREGRFPGGAGEGRVFGEQALKSARHVWEAAGPRVVTNSPGCGGE